ncbi:hypothetical protein HOLleu_17336 [Holothuria leucospilota]|uniref:Sulfotransferase n=1 Tax=Holothuria leucospilota TaxID=206669 RepID=A0A9Q1C7P9_HOLLE|nr:hypothetical protein HOLleu_17336 [Holothuria leucospilota]
MGDAAINNREIHNFAARPPSVDSVQDDGDPNKDPPQEPPQVIQEPEPTPVPQPKDGNSLPNFYLYDGEVSVYQQSVPVFVHIERSGGTTMKSCFNKTTLYFGNKIAKLLDLEGRKDVATLFKNAKITSKAYRLYVGDYAYGICENIPDRKCAYITILRDPYERLVSAYFDCRESEGKSGYELDCHTTDIQDWVLPISSMSLERFFTHMKCTPFIDKEHWFIPRYECDVNLSNMNTQPVFSANEHLVQYVLDNMDKMFALIGLTEEYIMTLQLLQNTYNFPFYEECKELVENKGTFADNSVKEQAKQALMSNEKVQQALSADLRIYEKGKEIFEKQKQKLASMFS